MLREIESLRLLDGTWIISPKDGLTYFLDESENWILKCRQHPNLAEYGRINAKLAAEINFR